MVRESRALSRAALMDLSPRVARLVAPDGSTMEAAPREVTVGDSFVVKLGERIPLDGRVKEGCSEVQIKRPLLAKACWWGKPRRQHLKAIAFDKTATLTLGRPQVIRAVSLN
jgi:cation transport ATPase